jgi:hypothetical protein
VLHGNSNFRLILIFYLFSAIAAAAGTLSEKPPGEFFPLQKADHEPADSFEQGQPIVGTTYFYWYDIDTKSHIIDGDGTDALTTHPADMTTISYKRPAWHKQQLVDMMDAGIDFLMPVFWGVPGKYDGWSFAGLPPLVEAHSLLQAEGKKPPAIGLFYDTSILKYNRFNKDGRSYHVDLTTNFGKEWFYTAIRDFYSLIPPVKWARIDGRPIIFFYASAFAKAQDPAQFDYVKRRFKADFGAEPFLVKSSGWKGPADAIYSWGGAVSGPLIYRHTVALGPGYDHSAVPGRQPLIVERRDGQTYIDRWLQLLALCAENRPWIIHVETWNEWHEGTDIAHSCEYGRSYIVLTRLFADMWRAKTVLKIASGYADADSVKWSPGKAEGLNIRPSGGDGVWKKITTPGVEAIVSAASPNSNRYLYFDTDGAFAYGLFDQTVVVKVTYRDEGCSAFCVEYDNTDRTKGPLEGAFRKVGNVTVGNTGQWKTAEFTLPQCRFMNRCNDADFRIAVLGDKMELAVKKVVVKRTTTTGEKQ